MNTKKATFGLVLILVGLLLLLRSMGIFSIGELTRYLLPLLFIFLGVWLIVRRRHLDERAPADDSAMSDTAPPPPPPPPGSPQTPPFTEVHRDPGPQPSGTSGGSASSGPSSGPEQPHVIYTNYQRQADGKLKYSRAFGDLLIDLAGHGVQDVEASAVLGDIEIKLHGCQLADGLNRLVVSGFIGDMRILVPRDLELFAHCSNFIGDIDLLGKRDSGFGNNMDAQTAGYNTATKRLYIAANNFIGDIRIILV